jgi:prophage DNA circulation protein
MTWTSGDLELAEYGGVEFHVQRVSDEIARRLAQYKYPYVDGGDLEDRGREPRTTSLTAVFQGPNYITELGRFLRVVDTDDSETFRHPLLGTWTAKVRRLGITHEDTARDMATVEIEVVEDGTRTSLPILFSVAQLSAEVTTQMTAWRCPAQQVSMGQSARCPQRSGRCRRFVAVGCG